MAKTAVIIGAGPAGLTAAYDLLTRTDIKPIVIEKTDQVGGISKTVRYKGYRMDIGGHRFFTKSERVLSWWHKFLPLVTTQNKNLEKVMLKRKRRSRIFYAGHYYDYPLRLSLKLLTNLGLIKTVKIGLTYLYQRLKPRDKEINLEDFFINRFGRELYNTFFRSYTEKVWGIPCHKISAEWGKQRVKGLSLTSAVTNALSSALHLSNNARQKQIETSLIESFMYPKYGPGQLWEEVAAAVIKLGGEIYLNTEVMQLSNSETEITKVIAKNHITGEERSFKSSYVFATMPLRELVDKMTRKPAKSIKRISDGLIYRDFLTVGILANQFKNKQRLADNWLYIHDPEVNVGRIQIFNNWSTSLVRDKHKVWLGLEYFCNDTDELWQYSESQLTDLAALELNKLGLVMPEDIIDSTVIRMPKAYPAYFGTYDKFPKLIAYLDTLENLFPIGRNGMHKYNNQDHSMVTAMTAVDNIIAGRKDKSNIWKVNTEDIYHETK